MGSPQFLAYMFLIVVKYIFFIKNGKWFNLNKWLLESDWNLSIRKFKNLWTYPRTDEENSGFFMINLAFLSIFGSNLCLMGNAFSKGSLRPGPLFPQKIAKHDFLRTFLGWKWKIAKKYNTKNKNLKE